ncbi:MAG: hypothetical protein WC989_04245 [Micavibrio sp.]
MDFRSPSTQGGKLGENTEPSILREIFIHKEPSIMGFPAQIQ